MKTFEQFLETIGQQLPMGQQPPMGQPMGQQPPMGQSPMGQPPAGQPTDQPPIGQNIEMIVDRLLQMIGNKSPQMIQNIRNELNRRLQQLQTEKKWGQQALTQSRNFNNKLTQVN